MITDTVPLPAAKHLPRIKVLSVAPLIGEAIRRIHRGESVGALFSSDLELVQEMLLWDESERTKPKEVTDAQDEPEALPAVARRPRAEPGRAADVAKPPSSRVAGTRRRSPTRR